MARGESPVDPRLVRALSRQLELRRRALAAGASHVGWKLGVGSAERIGGELAVGFLTSATQLEPGGVYEAGDAVDLRADAEVGVVLARDVEAGDEPVVGGYRAALELVDLAPPADAEDVVAANVFHRAFAFGPQRQEAPSSARLVVDGEVRDGAEASEELPARLAAAARVLAAAGERFRAGDVVITGSVVQVPVAGGDVVVADLGALGTVELRVA